MVRFYFMIVDQNCIFITFFLIFFVVFFWHPANLWLIFGSSWRNKKVQVAHFKEREHSVTKFFGRVSWCFVHTVLISPLLTKVQHLLLGAENPRPLSLRTLTNKGQSLLRKRLRRKTTWFAGKRENLTSFWILTIFERKRNLAWKLTGIGSFW